MFQVVARQFRKSVSQSGQIKMVIAMQKVADGKATKIIIPSELQGLAGLAASAKTVFDTEDPKGE